MQFSALTFAALTAYVYADDVPKCGAGLDLCPESYPCCGSDGVCANGYACMGGCDPRYSNTPGSCMPMPICQTKNYTLTDSGAFLNASNYRGDASANDFIYDGMISETDNGISAIMLKNNTATTISLNHYVWYGKITLKMKASTGSGVISDFILLSDAKDEIDYEMVGSNPTQAQTNYYWQGVLNYQNMKGADVSDVHENWHTYEVDWTEDKITWTIDGNSVRTLSKSDTYNSTSDSYSYPQTPSRVQFGLWAAGDSPYQGTSQWAGGEVDWSQAPYNVEVAYLNVECYDAPSGTSSSGSTSYRYTNANALSGDVEITGDSTVLESLDGTGENSCGSQCSSSSSSASAAATLGGSAASKSGSASATLSGSQSSSSADATLSGSHSESSSASASGSESSSGSSSASATGSESGSSSASASGSKTATATASSAAASGSSSDSSSSSAAANGAVALGVAALAPLAFIL